MWRKKSAEKSGGGRNGGSKCLGWKLHEETGKTEWPGVHKGGKQLNTLQLGVGGCRVLRFG